MSERQIANENSLSRQIYDYRLESLIRETFGLISPIMEESFQAEHPKGVMIHQLLYIGKRERNQNGISPKSCCYLTSQLQGEGQKVSNNVKWRRCGTVCFYCGRNSSQVRVLSNQSSSRYFQSRNFASCQALFRDQHVYVTVPKFHRNHTQMSYDSN